MASVGVSKVSMSVSRLQCVCLAVACPSECV